MQWKPLNLNSGSAAIKCVIAMPELRQTPESLCIVPAKSVEFVNDPELHDALLRPAVEGGAAVLCFPNYYGDLEQLSGRLKQEDSVNPFHESDRRIQDVVSQCLARELAGQGRIVLIGVSRFGFASLHAMANVSAVSAVAAISPVTHWPHLRELEGMDEHPMIKSSDLSKMADRFPPRPVLVQIGTSDERVSTERCIRFARLTARAYHDAGVPERFTFQKFEVPGHCSNSEFYIAVVDWLRQEGFLRPAG